MPSSPAQSSLDGRNARTPHLDALRIVAAVAVVVLHYAEYTKDNAAAHFVFAHVQHFNLFVDLFFVISGFVIARQYLEKVDTPVGVKRFLWRRVARIYPLHLLTLAFYLAIAAVLQLGLARGENPARYPLSDIPAQLLMLHAVVGERLTFNFPSWSLSAEMVCYLLFPLLAARRRQTADPRSSIVVLAALVGNSLYAAATGHGPVDRVDQSRRRLSRAAELRARHCALSLPRRNRPVAGDRACRSRLCCWPSCCSAARCRTALVLATVYAIVLLAVRADLDAASDAAVASRHRPLVRSHLFGLHAAYSGRDGRADDRRARICRHSFRMRRLMLVPVALAVLALASHLSYRYVETPIRHFLYALFDRRSEARLALPRNGARGAKADEQRRRRRPDLSIAGRMRGRRHRAARSCDRQPSRRRDPDGDRHPFAAAAAGFGAGAGRRRRPASCGAAVPVRVGIPDRTHAARSARKTPQGGADPLHHRLRSPPISTWPLHNPAMDHRPWIALARFGLGYVFVYYYVPVYIGCTLALWLIFRLHDRTSQDATGRLAIILALAIVFGLAGREPISIRC